ncbi:uncharacterized protein E0L32_008866 [Thyridium curvatum]|uniref:Zn(2)-C6 fungal-type domain-containing protein n=1 Tax=Thyridium curvatum TaxID=1093900 RepID=A0A507ATM4_9PEZI|nr:uncharacterized protein E0L32_008866 [Thyridium curvatum]TPX09844.1 hypothetical protein E0L32_008866 [Thyridium curvatum]
MSHQPRERLRRRSAPRSRNGCPTCKARHVKCDETRPACLRCTESGRVCDGYPQPQVRRGGLSQTSLGIRQYDLPYKVAGSQEDRLLLHYFCASAASELSGYLSSDFWTRLVLQVGEHEQVVRQAVVSLSSLHLELTTAPARHGDEVGPVQPGGPQSISHGTVVQYNKAMRSLRKYMNDLPEDGMSRHDAALPVLICSVLFYCFESARGDSAAAQQHLESGLAIIRGAMCRKDMPRSTPDIEELLQIFRRLDLQASMADDQRLPILISTPCPLDICTVDQLVGDLPFTSLRQAQAILTKLESRVLGFLISNNQYKFYAAEELPPWLVEQKALYAEQYDKWSVFFDEFTAQQVHPSTCAMAEFQSATLMLRIHYRIMLLLLQSSFPNDLSIFAPSPADPSKSAIAKVLEDARSIIEANDRPEGKRMSFSAETGVIAPLFLIAMKSGDLNIICQARLLLASSKRREGPYDTEMAGDILEGMMAFSNDFQGRPPSDMMYEDGSTMPLEYSGIHVLDSSVGLDGIARSLGAMRHVA